jgi:hypothetical protein
MNEIAYVSDRTLGAKEKELLNEINTYLNNININLTFVLLM